MSKFSPPDPPLIPDVADSEWGEIDAKAALAYDAATNTYQASIDWRAESVVLEVVAAVATVSNTPPLELPPLYGTIDQDAFDALADLSSPETGTRDVLIVMTYAGYEVAVTGDGVLSIRLPPTEPTEEQ